MIKRYTDEFRRDAVRMATTSGLAGEICFHRCLERRMVCGVPLPNYEGHITRVPCLAGAPNEPATA